MSVSALAGEGKKSPDVRAWLVAVLAVAAALAIARYAYQGVLVYTSDSVTYRDAALHVLGGEPGRLSNIESEMPASVPNAVWPPLYPLSWALVKAVSGASIDQAASLLAFLLGAVTALGVFIAGLRCTGQAWLSAGVTVLHACMLPIIVVFGHAWSETVFLPLLLFAYLSLLRYLDTRKLGALMMAAVLIGLANWARYAAAIFIPLLALTVWIGARGPARWWHAALAGGVSTLVTAPAWFYAWSVSGHIAGSQRGGAATPARLIGDLGELLSLAAGSLVTADPALLMPLKWPLVVFVVATAALCFYRYGAKLLRNPHFLVPVAWGIAYLLFLLYARVANRELDLDLRMLAPAATLFLLALLPVLSLASRERGGAVRPCLAILCALLPLSGLSAAGTVHSTYAQLRDVRWPASPGTVYIDLRKESGTSQFFRNRMGDLGDTKILLTDRPLYIRYLTGVPAYQLNSTRDCRNWEHQNVTVFLSRRTVEEVCGSLPSRWRVVGAAD
jgi:hypothetical protein